MAIKTTGTGANRRIITKLVDGQRLVSCSCCEEEAGCCMYPADQLGIGYEAVDLPDEIEVYNSDGGVVNGPFILNHNGDATYGTLTPPPFTGHYVYHFGEDWIYARAGGAGGTGCLMLGDYGETPTNSPANRGWTFDRFADTYNVYIPYDGGIDIEVTRESLCRWYGTVVIGGLTYGATLYYNDGTGEIATLSPAHTWNISPFVTGGGIEILGTKTSQQGTPLGNYTATQGGDIYTYVVSP